VSTYKQIQDYIKKCYGITPKTCHIAHVKEICGLPLRKAWNRQAHTKRKYPCPSELIPKIKTAFIVLGDLQEIP
jgi:hypothetical protein